MKISGRAGPHQLLDRREVIVTQTSTRLCPSVPQPIHEIVTVLAASPRFGLLALDLRQVVRTSGGEFLIAGNQTSVDLRVTHAMVRG